MNLTIVISGSTEYVIVDEALRSLKAVAYVCAPRNKNESHCDTAGTLSFLHIVVGPVQKLFMLW